MEDRGSPTPKNLLDREGLVQNALQSLKGEVEAPFEFPLTTKIPPLDTYRPSIESLSNSTLVEESTRVCETLAPRTKGQVNLSNSRSVVRTRLLNSRGTDLSTVFSVYSFGAEILYPASYSGIQRQLFLKEFEPTPQAYAEYLLDLYNRSQNEVTLKGGRMNVLFLPETMYVLMWRLQSATNGRNIYQKISPVLDKMGEKIFDEKVTIFDDPLDDGIPGASAFDDEGTSTRASSIIQKGTLTSFYYDLFYAGKLKTAPTGHGYKSSMWGGETVSFRPSPSLRHLKFEAGGKSLSEIIRSMDRGVIVAGAIGAHSGNILQGEFSIGLSPGLYVEKGEIAGHVKNTMVSGNIFETMRNVVEIEDTLHPAYTGQFPAVLFGDVSVATKG